MESPPPEALAEMVDRSDEPAQDDLRLRSLAVDIVVRPVSAMRRLAAHPGRRWLWPMLLLTIVGVASTAAAIPASRDYQQQVTRTEMSRQFEQNPEAFGDRSAEEIVEMTTSGPLGMAISAFALIGAAISVVLGITVVAAVIHFLGTVLGGQQNFSQMLTVVSWAHVPFVFRELLRFVSHTLGRFDPNPSGLSGLVACNPLDPSCEQSYLQPILAQIELWNLWYWALLVIGIGIVCHVSRRKALAVVATIVVVQVLIGTAGVFVSSKLSGLTG